MANESFLTPRTSPDPGFYLIRFWFKGQSDPDLDARPHLKIWYSWDESIGGEAP
jgi:hypothetical protein